MASDFEKQTESLVNSMLASWSKEDRDRLIDKLKNLSDDGWRDLEKMLDNLDKVNQTKTS